MENKKERGNDRRRGFYGVANDFSRLKTISVGSFQSAGNAISKRLEGPKYQNFPGAAPLDPPGGAYSAPRPPSCFNSAASRRRKRRYAAPLMKLNLQYNNGLNTKCLDQPLVSL